MPPLQNNESTSWSQVSATSEADTLYNQVELVRQKGDPLDAISPPYRTIGIDSALAIGVPSVLWCEFAESYHSTELTTTFPLAALGTAAVAIAAHKAFRFRAVQNYQNRSQQQVILRQELGEPIDVFRSGTKSNGYETVLRWYGADGGIVDEDGDEGRHKLSICTKLNKLLSKTYDASIDKVAIGTQWLDADAEHLDIKDYGTVVAGADFIGLLGKSENIKLTDKLVTEPILLTTPQRARELLREARKAAVYDIRAFLSQTIGEHDSLSRVPALFDAWIEAGADLKLAGDIKRTLQGEIERTLMQQSDPERVITKGEDGELYRHKSSQTITVRGNSIAARQDYKDQFGLARTVLSGGKQSLLKQLGFTDLNDLLDKLGDADKADKAALNAEVGLLLLLCKIDDTDEERVVAVGREDVELEIETQTTDTLLQRFGQEKPWKTHRFSRELSTYQGSATMNYQTPLSERRQLGTLVRFAGLYLTPIVGLVSAGLLHSHVLNRSIDQPNEFKAEYGLDSTADPALYERYLEQQSWYDSASKTIVLGAQDIELSIESKIHEAEASLNLDFMIPGNGSDESKMNGPPMATGRNTAPADAGIGDVTPPKPGELNPVYHVEAYDGFTTDGYWASQVDNVLNLHGTSAVPFTDASISFSSGNIGIDIQELPTEPVTSQTLMYKVTAPYETSQYQIAMPMQEHTVPVAASLSFTDFNGDTITQSPRIIHEGQTGIYTAERGRNLTDSLATDQVLTYYLAASDEIVHARGPLQTPSNVDMEVVQASTTAALGLAPEATDKQIFNSIQQGKRYSFTPYADADIHGIKTGFSSDPYANNTQPLAIIGETLAGVNEANCNMAAAQDLLATAGKDNGRVTNMVTGFHNNGDNDLDSGELHAWITDESGTIKDPTPASLGNIETEPQTDYAELFKTIAVDGGSAVAFGALAFLTYRRRKDIREMLDERKRDRIIRNRHAARAITALQQAEYSPEASGRISGRRNPASWITELEKRPTTDRLAAIPDINFLDANALLASKNVQIPRRVRKAMKTLLRHRETILKEQ